MNSALMIYRGSAIVNFAQAAVACAAVPRAQLVGAPRIPEHGVMRERGAEKRLGHGDAGEGFPLAPSVPPIVPRALPVNVPCPRMGFLHASCFR